MSQICYYKWKKLKQCAQKKGSYDFLKIPLSIFTATVVQVVAFSMPNAEASTTWPKAPRPSGSPATHRETRCSVSHQCPQEAQAKEVTEISDAILTGNWIILTHLAWVGLWETPTCWHRKGASRSAHPSACHPRPGSLTGSQFSAPHLADTQRERERARWR